MISKGPEVKKVPVPNFVNRKIDDVMLMMETLGLQAEILETWDETREKGTVLYQSVIAESEVEVGTTIVFHISSGPTEGDNPMGGSDMPGADDPVEEPTVTPSQPPENPDVPGTPPVDQPVIATTKTIQVDLSEYTAVVQVRIEVGDSVQYNSPVNPVALSSLSRTITGTGVQAVSIYINDRLVSSYVVSFS